MRIVVSAVLLAALALTPASALATEAIPDVPTAHQYVETLPGVSGPTAPSLRRGGQTRGVPPALLSRIRAGGGAFAPLMRDLVGSSAYGAQAPRHSKPAHPGAGSGPSHAERSALSAAADSGGGLTWLLIAMLVGAAASAGWMAYRRRQSGHPA